MDFLSVDDLDTRYIDDYSYQNAWYNITDINLFCHRLNAYLF